MNQCASFVAGALACLLASFAYQQDPSKPAAAEIARPSDPIESERAKLLESMAGPFTMPMPPIRAIEAHKGDLKGVSDADLAFLAVECNRAERLLRMILDEYESYERANSNYDFIVKAVREKKMQMEVVRRLLTENRNSIYFEQAVRLRDAGETMRAFVTFHDAFRLSPFEGDGMRLKAEQEMKKLLGIDALPSYVTWEK